MFTLAECNNDVNETTSRLIDCEFEYCLISSISCALNDSLFGC